MRDVPNGTTGTVRLPQIVPIVLREVARLRDEGHLTQTDFEQKLARLTDEEITPRSLELLVRDLPKGAIRFLIKNSRTGRICEMIDYQGKRPVAADGPWATEREAEAVAIPPLRMAGGAGA